MTTQFSQALFDNPEVWDSETWQKRAGDRVRARLAAEWLPADVISVLDVGCGNGVFTNLMESDRFKVGLDMSRIALEHITAPRLQGDAAKLSFADHSFDACLSMELLEHLPFPFYQRALNELVRVAKKFILITVPYNEVLKYNTVICPKCQSTFHPFNHLREFRRDDFQSLFGTAAHLVRLEGIVPIKRDALPGLRNIYRLYQHRKGRNFPRMAICPQCGYALGKNTITIQNISSSHRMRSILSHFWPKQKSFTWWMALYRDEA
jgi:SAM-dependent methyltransferase